MKTVTMALCLAALTWVGVTDLQAQDRGATLAAMAMWGTFDVSPDVMESASGGPATGRGGSAVGFARTRLMPDETLDSYDRRTASPRQQIPNQPPYPSAGNSAPPTLSLKRWNPYNPRGSDMVRRR